MRVWVQPHIRDEIVRFVGYYAQRTGVAISRLTGWIGITRDVSTNGANATAKPTITTPRSREISGLRTGNARRSSPFISTIRSKVIAASRT